MKKLYRIIFMDWVLENKGDLGDDTGWEDAYYGVTKWGWERVEGASEDDMDVLEHLGIAQVAKHTIGATS